MLTGLGHRTVSRGNNKDSTIHLCSTGDHVFDVVSMSGAVNVSIVTVVSLILNVSGVDRDTTSFFFRSLIDCVICLVLSIAFKAEVLGDGSGKGGLTMVDMTDGTDINMGFGSLKMLFCHLRLSSLRLILSFLF